MKQQKQQQLPLFSVILLLLALAATVASVPTSVLVQNSELTSNTNANANKNNNNNKHTNNNDINTSRLLTKVKRSSNNAKELSSSITNGAALASGTGLDKKSSPEIVPASFNAPPSQSSPLPVAAAANALPTNGDILNSAIAAGLTAAAAEAAAAANQRELEHHQQQLYGDEYFSGAPALLQKRGINAQQLYGPSYNDGYDNNDFYSNPYVGAAPASAAAGVSGASMTAVPNGVWADDIDPAIVYTDMQDVDDYEPSPRGPTNRNKPYDNLQNILNSEAYLEPVVLPLPQYANRFYGSNVADVDRNKRTNFNKYNKYGDIPRMNKRDTKLTPADMLALVALVEAGERARKDTDSENEAVLSSGYMYPAEQFNNGKAGYYANAYEYPALATANVAADDVDYNGAVGNGAWLEPAVVDYYGVPVNMESMPKYELMREHKYAGGNYNNNNNNNNRYAAKRFMVAKKKRSMGKFLNDPVAKPSISYPAGNANGKFY